MESDLSENQSSCCDHFNNDGYHGATIEISQRTSIALSRWSITISKAKEAISRNHKKDYFELLDRPQSKSKLGYCGFYTQYVFKLNKLSDYDKKVFRLGIKVNLSFDGDDELREIMDEWERA